MALDLDPVRAAPGVVRPYSRRVRDNARRLG